MKVQLFVPCFVDQLFPDTAFNTIRLLERAGCEVIYNDRQTCCGQPAFNAGFANEARTVCQKWFRDFDPNIPVVAPSASCTGFIRNYAPKLLGDEIPKPPIWELSEFLVHERKQIDFGARFAEKVTYHDSCAGLRECGIRDEPWTLMAAVKGLELLELPGSDVCCGFGGTFAVKFSPISMAMAEQKVTAALTTGATTIVSTDLSCLMHLEGYIKQKGLPLRCMHLADLLVQGWDEDKGQ